MTARCLVDVSSPSQSDAATGWSATVTGLISWSEVSDEVIANTDNNAWVLIMCAKRYSNTFQRVDQRAMKWLPTHWQQLCLLIIRAKRYFKTFQLIRGKWSTDCRHWQQRQVLIIHGHGKVYFNTFQKSWSEGWWSDCQHFRSNVQKNLLNVSFSAQQWK